MHSLTSSHMYLQVARSHEGVGGSDLFRKMSNGKRIWIAPGNTITVPDDRYCAPAKHLVAEQMLGTPNPEIGMLCLIMNHIGFKICQWKLAEITNIFSKYRFSLRLRHWNFVQFSAKIPRIVQFLSCGFLRAFNWGLTWFGGRWRWSAQV